MKSSLPPPIPSRNVTSSKDGEHIKLLIVFHYVLAGFGFIGLLFLLFHFIVMNSIFGNEELWNEASGSAPPEEMFWVFGWFYLLMGGLILMSCVLNILSPCFMKKRKHHTFSIVVSGINCLSVPLGTTLGIFTIVVLLRPSVQDSYQKSGAR